MMMMMTQGDGGMWVVGSHSQPYISIKQKRKVNGKSEFSQRQLSGCCCARPSPRTLQNIKESACNPPPFDGHVSRK